MEYSTYGRHVAADLWGVPFEVLDDADALNALLWEAAEQSGAEVLGAQTQKFEPQGATVLILLSESHLSIHTYPERGFAALDCYTCGDTVNPQDAIDFIIERLQPKKVFHKTLYRGNEDTGITE